MRNKRKHGGRKEDRIDEKRGIEWKGKDVEEVQVAPGDDVEVCGGHEAGVAAHPPQVPVVVHPLAQGHLEVEVLVEEVVVRQVVVFLVVTSCPACSPSSPEVLLV